MNGSNQTLGLVLETLDPDLVGQQAITQFHHNLGPLPDHLADLTALAVNAGVLFAFQAFCQAIQLAASTDLDGMT